MATLHKLHDDGPLFSTDDNDLLTDDIGNNHLEESSTSNFLRQRQITTNHLNDSYDLLEQDLAYLREAMDEVATLVAQQQLTLSKMEQIKHAAHYRVHSASSFFQKVIQNPYVTYTSGALLGASLTGPVGFMMGTKVGTLLALSGSAVGALSINIMRQRATETEDSQSNTTTTYSQAML